MKILIVGSGGREHAICWKVKQSKLVTEIFCAPGNPGTAAIAENINIKVDDIDSLVSFAKEKGIDFTIVGPELPLTLGIVDKFRDKGLKIFGATKDAANLENSKFFAKEVMREAGVLTPQSNKFPNRPELLKYLNEQKLPVVLKADGLASGKGVFVCHQQQELDSAIDQLYIKNDSAVVLVEEFIKGPEASFIVATNGKTIVPMATSHDYKRIGDGNTGLNTGGMGAVSPTPFLTKDQEIFAIEKIIKPVLQTMAKRGTPFSGFLYAGLMIPKGKDPYVIEFNARLGDPETQVIMRRMDDDFVEVMVGLEEERVNNSSESSDIKVKNIKWSDQTAVCVVLASKGYPESSSSGDVITGIDAAEKEAGVVVFHAGTNVQDGKLVTAGGRVLNVTGMEKKTESALGQIYGAVKKIKFPGMQLRSDIGGGNELL